MCIMFMYINVYFNNAFGNKGVPRVINLYNFLTQAMDISLTKSVGMINISDS